MITFFAHAGEQHDSAATTASHYLQEWYIAVPLFLLCLAGAATVIYFISQRSKAATYISVVFLLLIAGVATYAVSTIISILSLTLGMAMILAMVLLSLAKPVK